MPNSFANSSCVSRGHLYRSSANKSVGSFEFGAEISYTDSDNRRMNYRDIHREKTYGRPRLGRQRLP